MIGIGALVLAAASLAAPCQVPKRLNGNEALVATLQFELKANDLENHPIEGAQFQFLDTGVSEGQKHLLGRTAKDGTARATLLHQWRDYFKEERNPNSGTFDIVVVAAYGASVVRHFAIECLKKRGEDYLVTLAVSLPNSLVIE